MNAYHKEDQPMPQNFDLEQVVIGAIVCDSTAYYTANDVQPLNVSDFYNDDHKAIFEVVKKLADKRVPLDIVTISKEIMGLYPKVANEIIQTMISATNRIGSTAHLEAHILQLKEFSARRSLIVQSHNTRKRAYDNSIDVFDLINEHQKGIAGITDGLTEQAEDIETVFNKIDQSVYSVGQPLHVVCSTGIMELDNLVGGVEDNDIIVIGGCSGSGKTAMMCCLIVEMLKAKKQVVVFSYEMTAKSLLMRILAAYCEISYDSMKNGCLDETELLQYEAAKKDILKDSLIHIFYCAGTSIEGLVSKAIAAKIKIGKIDGVFIDYLQLIPSENKRLDDNARAAYCMVTLMGLRKKLDCPLFPLSQLNKSVGSERPKVYHLFGAQMIEATATKILLLHRPEKFQIDTFEDGSSSIGRAEIVVAKNREGMLGVCKAKYKGAFYKFDNDEQTNFFEF